MFIELSRLQEKIPLYTTMILATVTTCIEMKGCLHTWMYNDVYIDGPSMGTVE